jgi:hypothetical protein
MRYRAVLVGVVSEDGKPKQVFGQTLGPIYEWAKAVLSEPIPGAQVQIFEMEERLYELYDGITCTKQN